MRPPGIPKMLFSEFISCSIVQIWAYAVTNIDSNLIEPFLYFGCSQILNPAMNGVLAFPGTTVYRSKIVSSGSTYDQGKFTYVLDRYLFKRKSDGKDLISSEILKAYFILKY